MLTVGTLTRVEIHPGNEKIVKHVVNWAKLLRKIG
jgi:hypothetical protein